MIKLLKDSEQDFRFDEQRVKDRLLYSLRETPIKAPARTFFTFRFMKYSALVAGLVIFLSATFVLALNANPGDRLFGLNKFGENVILSLPLSMEQKAQVQAGIVTRRLEALQEIEAQPAGPGLETKQLETIKESDESIQNAIDTVTANKVKLENSGQTASAEKKCPACYRAISSRRKYRRRGRITRPSGAGRPALAAQRLVRTKRPRRARARS